MTAAPEQPHRLLLNDPVSGETLDYADIGSHLRQDIVEFTPCLQPATPGEAVKQLLTALVLGQHLVLIDSDLSAAEIEGMGSAVKGLNRTICLPGLSAADFGTLQQLSQVQSGFRLTLHTSGSTGLPKCVRHTLLSLTRTLKISSSQRESIWAMAYNPTHIAGVQVILQAFFNSNPLILLHSAAAPLVLDQIRLRNVTHLAGTPSFFRLLLPIEAPLPGVRAIALGGEQSPPQLIERLQNAFPNARIRNLYGSTEAGTLLIAEGDRFRIPQQLRAQIRIRNGQLEVQQQLLGEFSGGMAANDGWYRTGDIVDPCDDGSFRIVSRTVDWINVGGHKVNPAEVEAVLRAHPAVREALVYPQPNSVLGQIVAARVVRREASTLDTATLRSYLAESLQTAKVPRKIEFVDHLPRSSSGKLLRGV